MTSTALERALTGPGPPALHRLPAEAENLLRHLEASPRLAAHLRAVHDVARRLLDWLCQRHPEITVDHEAVLFGAAIHDIGKTLHTAELSGPGSAHEQAGHRLLLDLGIPAGKARFALTHADWTRPNIKIEDLLVSLADKIWKAKRLPDLEQLLVDHLATAGGQPTWEVFMALDDLLTHIAADSDQRLAFQSGHPIAP